MRKCREYAIARGWQEVRTYDDPKLPGGSIDRRGVQSLMRDAANPNRDFDVILIDTTSRLARTLRDTFDLHGDFEIFGVRVVAVSQGIDTDDEQSDVLIAVHGIMDSVYLKELAKATHRGLEGRVLKGLSAGGRCYGYDTKPVEHGGVQWIINPDEAAIIRQIFEWSAVGYSLKRIAGLLNEQKTPPPRKRTDRPYANWCPTAIREMLRRELYVGHRVWNKTKFIKKPGTNKRIARPRPSTEWKALDLPELQIVSQELWNRVQVRQDRLKEIYADSGRKPMNRGYPSAYLLSGFLKCGVCKVNMIIVSGGGRGARYGCPQHWNRKDCSNKLTIRHEDLERVLLEQLQKAVLTPEAIDYLVGHVLQAQDRRKSKSEHRAELLEISSKIDRITAAIEAAGHSDALLKNLKSLESQQRETAAKGDNGHQLTEPQIRQHIAGALQEVSTLLLKSPQLAKSKLAEHVDAVRLLPQADGTYIAEGEWDLLGNRGPVMVAGAGFEPATFGL
jgi:site-specific DNA recombinase